MDDDLYFEIDEYLEDFQHSNFSKGKKQVLICDNCVYGFSVPQKAEYIPICPICGCYIEDF
jgi:hypothetical protein